MRDHERLEEFYTQMKTVHKKNFPDWRFGQFIKCGGKTHPSLVGEMRAAKY